ncbi:MAG TPA: SDR family oxidoreductase [Thermomicrobiales bacterium]|nr:SDR family oxidoreductase [Thermomicrobiales bacterium]
MHESNNLPTEADILGPRSQRAIDLKPIAEQVVVILGASSGIGRETAMRFAERGASVVVAARDELGLTSLVEEITRSGGQAIHVVCDVSDFEQVEGVAAAAVGAYGRIDTWVNVAAVSVYATFEDTSLEEFRRIMDVNFMGQVHGAKAALPHLRREGRGALIAISSVESIVSLPLHSAYAASKHAVEGVFDALRRELMAGGVPISVTSVKPATINTPFFNNSRSKIGVEPKGPPPIYEPGVVADCVLYAAEHPVRDLFAGGAGRMMIMNQALAPGAMDAVLTRVGIPLQRTDEPPTEGNLYQPQHDSRISGDYGDQARKFSAYTWLQTHPRERTLAIGASLATTLLLARRR